MIINGKKVCLEGTWTIAQYLKQQGYQFNRIAVERNGKILPKDEYETTILQDMDHIEVVSFVGGG